MRNNNHQPFYRQIVYWLLLILSSSLQALEISPLYNPLPALTARELAVIVNDADPLSVQIASYYQRKRSIPPAQLIHVKFNVHSDAMSQSQFESLKKQVDQQTPKHVQAYALTWIQPFKVDCMSITTAFAFGFDKAFCAKGCLETRKSPYFASNSTKPFREEHLRPTMLLAAQNFAQAKQLIDRGVTADYTHPQGSGYLLKTSDAARSSRAELFPKIAEKFTGVWPVYYLQQDALENKSDVVFYFTGLVKVPNINSNIYLPGAVADHLTSTGGVLSGSGQMNSLEWLKAGATGSYGAVVEPCNFPGKFPNPEVLIYFYLRGSSLIEAYWKSVQQPGQGIFIGEPLAKPFAYPLQKESSH
ncbi:MAG: TIGR03790 family protein [Methylococcales bacterium]